MNLQYGAQENNIYQNFIGVAQPAQHFMVQPLQIENQLIAPYLNNSQEISLKNLDFKEQKQYLVKVVLFMILWQFTQEMVLLILVWMLSKKNFSYHANEYFGFLFCFFFVAYIYLIRLGSLKSNRNGIFPHILFFCSAGAQALVLFSLFGSTTEYGRSMIDMGYLILFLIFGVQFIYFCAIVFSLLYILTEQRQLQYFKLIIFDVIITCPLLLFNEVWYILVASQLLTYSYLIINVLKQISNGRFNLKKNQVISGALAANFGIYVPCQPEE